MDEFHHGTLQGSLIAWSCGIGRVPTIHLGGVVLMAVSCRFAWSSLFPCDEHCAAGCQGHGLRA